MKKLFSFVALAFCLAVSAASYGQSQNMFLLADNIQGTSLLAKNGIDISSMGTGLACSGCMTIPTGSGAGKITGGKIVFNMNNEVSVNALRSQLFKGGTNGNAYFIFSKSTGTGKPGNYYYIRLFNYTVLEVEEATDAEGSTSIQVSLGYSGLAWAIKPQSVTTGVLGTPVLYGWDFSKNTEITASAIPTGY